MQIQLLTFLDSSLSEIEELLEASMPQIKQALELLVELMNCLCLEIESILSTTTHKQFLVIWNRLNNCWTEAVGCTTETGKDLEKRYLAFNDSDWLAVRDALESSCNILELYGLVD